MVSVKSKWFDHLGLKVLSLLIAIIIWIIVANVDDYKTAKEITGIEIDFINGDAITEKNRVYEVPEGTTVNVVVKGRRKVVEHLDSGDFKAVADLSKMSVTNAVAVDVSAVSPTVNKELTISNTTNSVVIAVENKIERQLPVAVRALSEVADGYAISNRTATPNLITVKGAESAVNTIEEVVVDVNVSGKNRNVTMQAAPIFLDKSGRVLDASKFEYDVTRIDALVEILPTKQILVKLETTGAPADGYLVANVDYQPTEIHVVGKAGILSSLNEVVINDIDVTGCNKDLETSVDILNYLPNGVSMVGDNSEIMVKIAIEKVLEKTFTLSPKDINIVGKDDKLEYTILNDSDIKLSLGGLKENLNEIKISEFLPSINISGYGPGEYKVQLNLQDIEGIDILKKDIIKIEIKEKE